MTHEEAALRFTRPVSSALLIATAGNTHDTFNVSLHHTHTTDSQREGAEETLRVCTLDRSSSFKENRRRTRPERSREEQRGAGKSREEQGGAGRRKGEVQT